MIRKLLRFARADQYLRRRLLKNALSSLSAGARFFFFLRAPIYWAYKPDSDWFSSQHPELAQLMTQWIAKNKKINSGDFPRFVSLVLNIKQVLRETKDGDFAELGVYRGNSASVLAHFAAGAGRKLFLFDTFEGFDGTDLIGIDSEKPPLFSDTSITAVRSVVGHDESCIYLKGLFPGTVTAEVTGSRYAFVHLDCDLYKPTIAALDFFFARLVPGGMIFVHDYSSGEWLGIEKAVDEFSASTGILPILLPDKSGTAVFRRPRM
jgi:hypothetical protein